MSKPDGAALQASGEPGPGGWSPETQGQLLRLGLSRCLRRAACGVEEGAWVELLATLFGGDVLRASSFAQAIASPAGLLDLYIGPLRTALIDRFGRRAGMVWPGGVLALLQLWYVHRPSKLRYAVLEVLSYVMMSFLTSYQAALQDLLDPTTDQ